MRDSPLKSQLSNPATDPTFRILSHYQVDLGNGSLNLKKVAEQYFDKDGNELKKVGQKYFYANGKEVPLLNWAPESEWPWLNASEPTSTPTWMYFGIPALSAVLMLVVMFDFGRKRRGPGVVAAPNPPSQ